MKAIHLDGNFYKIYLTDSEHKLVKRIADKFRISNEIVVAALLIKGLKVLFKKHK